ncbi:bacteriophage Rz lysis protein [Erwinia rhapontici]|nr:bacteriophage Rz lysis protein [Erwinia rhapontici]
MGISPTLNIPQARFLAMPHKFKAYVAGFGSGKTWVGADAQASIDQPQSDVAAGRKLLQLNATCPAVNATGANCLGDATAPRLNDAAERDYFTLRQRISTVSGK